MPRLASSSAPSWQQLRQQLDRRRAAPLSPRRLLALRSGKKPAAKPPAPAKPAPPKPAPSDSAPPPQPPRHLNLSRAPSSRLSEQFAAYQASRSPQAAAAAAAAPLPSQPQSVEDLKPQPLTRPLGQPSRPAAGENPGTDARSLRQRRDDLFDWDKHLARRSELTAAMAKPYFRDWSNMRFQKGKVFVAPARLFRADRALFFPNLRGVTLAEPRDEQDTTPALAGRITVVSAYTGDWAQQQTRSFVGDGNPALRGLLDKGRGFVQTAEINIEDKALRYALVKAFMYRQRRRLPPDAHGRYFAVHRGFAPRLREMLGMFNTSVGYIFLLDAECRVRWAASAEAQDGEVESMNRGLVRLAREYQSLAQRREREPAEEDVFFDLIGQYLDPREVGKAVDAMAGVLSDVAEAAADGVKDAL